MDIIAINHLWLDACLGLLPWEKQVRQPICISLQLGCDAQAVAVADDLSLGVDYFAVSQWLKEQLVAEVELLEVLAEKLAQGLLAWPGVQAVRLCIEKPWAVPGASSASLTIVRGQPFA